MAIPVSSGTVELVDVESKMTVGYGFVAENVSPDGPHTQRWVLYEDYCAPPLGSIIFRPPEDPARQYARLEAWKAALTQGDLWRDGARYVKSSCIPYASIDDSPLPTFPEKQFDNGASQFVQNGVTRGWVFTTTIGIGQTYEHWVLRDGYASPTGHALTAEPAGPGGAAPTLNDFLDQMRASWTAGSTYAVAACTTFNELPAPQAL